MYEYSSMFELYIENEAVLADIQKHMDALGS